VATLEQVAEFAYEAENAVKRFSAIIQHPNPDQLHKLVAARIQDIRAAVTAGDIAEVELTAAPTAGVSEATVTLPRKAIQALLQLAENEQDSSQGIKFAFLARRALDNQLEPQHALDILNALAALNLYAAAADDRTPRLSEETAPTQTAEHSPEIEESIESGREKIIAKIDRANKAFATIDANAERLTNMGLKQVIRAPQISFTRDILPQTDPDIAALHAKQQEISRAYDAHKAKGIPAAEAYELAQKDVEQQSASLTEQEEQAGTAAEAANLPPVD